MTVVSTVVRPDGQWQVVTYSDGSTSCEPVPGGSVDTALVNLAALQANAQAALTTNATFLGTVATRRTAIANGKSTAQTGTTVTVSNVAAAQTQIRSIWSTLVQIATALDDLNNDAESITKQNDGVIRLLLGLFDSTAGT